MAIREEDPLDVLYRRPPGMRPIVDRPSRPGAKERIDAVKDGVNDAITHRLRRR